MNAVARKVDSNGRLIIARKTGYSQNANRRWSVFDFIRMIILRLMDVDCSAAFVGLSRLAGIQWRTGVALWTGSIPAEAKRTGMYSVTRFDGDLTKLRPGGALCEPGRHIVTALAGGDVLSPEINELGTTTGGKPGAQTSREVRIRRRYLRRPSETDGGWTWLINLLPASVHATRAIVAFGRGQAWRTHTDRMTLLAPHDGPLYRQFLKAWTRLNRGLNLAFSATTMVGLGRVAIVILGSGLTDDGQITAAYRARLQLGLDQAITNPDATVVVTGGRPRKGITEAAAGRQWLVDHGLNPARIAVEDQSDSTVGNARGTIPLLMELGVDRYLLVSHASHLRRASIDFLAAALRAETVDNTAAAPTPILTPLAIDDYAPAPVKTAGPVDPDDRLLMAAEALAVLGI